MAEAAEVLKFETSPKPDLYLVPEVSMPEVNEYQKAYDDAATFFAETLEGPIRTGFEFNFDGKELYSRDGRALKPVFEDALVEAGQIAANKPNLLFELRRRQIELDEYFDMIQMAEGELPNTMVVLSDFPGELVEAEQDVGGYNVRRKQTFLRVITRNSEGNINIESQSLDLSDRASLEAIYEYFDLVPDKGELLGQRININLAHEEQELLIDKLTGVYDRTLAAQYGGEWYGGRRPANYDNTYRFVRDQHDMIDLFANAKTKDSIKAESLRYNIAAAIEQRFRMRNQPSEIAPQIINRPTDIRYEIQNAGLIARSQGKKYNGCGLTLEAVLNSESSQQLTDLNYGNQTKSETNYKFDNKRHCVVCQSPPKKNEPEKMCGPCGICRGCDSKLRVKSGSSPK